MNNSKILSILLLAFFVNTTSLFATTEYTAVDDLTANYFIMAFDDNGTYKSPYWTKAHAQNVISPAESASTCGGDVNYYLMKAEQVEYNEQTCYRIGIYNSAHEMFSGVAGGGYLNSAGWVFFAGQSEPEGQSHIYGQDADALGLFFITYTEGKGFQFQCVGNSKYINGTMGHSGTADKYFWYCFAEGDLYNDVEALKTSSPYLAYNDIKKNLDVLVANTDDYTVDDADRATFQTSLDKAAKDILAITSIDDITSIIAELQTAAVTFISQVTVNRGQQLNITGLITNASFPGNTEYGWTGTTPGFQSYTNAEYFAKKYDLSQTIPNMPAGIYLLRVQAFERPDASGANALETYLNGNESTDAFLYLGDQSVALNHIGKYAQDNNAVGGSKFTVNESTYYMPDDMNGSAKFFNQSMYWNSVKLVSDTTGGLKLGIKCDVSTWGWWTCFDNFELYYLGQSASDDDEPAEGEYFNYTSRITNPSFELGTEAGWSYSKVGDSGVKNNEGVYETSGIDGEYQFNAYVTSETYVAETQCLYVNQTLEDLPAGEYHLKAYAASNTYNSVKTPVTLFANKYTASFIPPSKSAYNDYELVFYVTPDDKSVNIGMRSASWFKADNFRLYWYGRTKQYEHTRRLSTVEKYEEIASQAIDRTEYDKVLATVREALEADEVTDAQVAEQNDILRTALLNLVKNGTTATGQFNITALVENPDFEMNTEGWDATGTTLTWGGTGLAQVVGNKNEAKIMQTLESMPAGHYTLKAQAFHRPTNTAASLEMAEQGNNLQLVNLFVNEMAAPVNSITDETRFVVASQSDIYSTINGKGFPTSTTTASEAFLKGDYWNIVEFDLSEEGALNIGLSVDATSLTESWLVFDNITLIYGETPDTILNVNIAKDFLTPICLPTEIKAEHIGETYLVGGIYDKKVLLYPVQTVKAGQPCVVRANHEINGISLKATDISARQADTYLLPWEGGSVRADDNFCWINTSVDGTETPAADLNFEVIDRNNLSYTVNMENLMARRFIGQTTYTDDNGSVIGNFQTAPPARRDLPNSVSIPIPDTKTDNIIVNITDTLGNSINSDITIVDDLAYIRNLQPQQTYRFELMADGNCVSRGVVHTEGRLRMIYVPSISNVRDLGGWVNDEGKTVSYGKVYRGGELNGDHVATVSDINELKNHLNVGAEIDLRIDYDNKGAGKSAFGFEEGTTYYYANANDFVIANMSDETSHTHWREEFNLMVKNLEEGKSVYFHCIWGADRTGLYAMLLEGILGLPVDAIYKDYELTSYSLAGGRWKQNMKPMVQYIEAMEGETLQRKFNTFFTEQLGVDQSVIDSFRRIMLGDEDANEIKKIESDCQNERVLNNSIIYNLNGQRVSNPQRGIYIYRFTDGTSKKLLIK